MRGVESEQLAAQGQQI